ncbi:hypothetical protein K7432_018646 [Basidiobolus ranarum]|uniref:Chromatin modification-related protein n=1 Tax=Basidiobolus ranarum TaxID=34480 RepID=A0ABR2WZW6_9FUNG
MDHLEDYFDTLDSLPSELQRNSTLWKEVAGSFIETNNTYESILDGFLNTIDKRKSTEERISSLKVLNQSITENTKQEVKKLNLAVKLADTVDRHVNRLEYHFLGFQEVLSGDKNLKETNQDISHERKENKKGNVAPSRVPQQNSTSSRHTKKDIEEPLEQVTKRNHEIGIDPNEPTYCYCNQISFGEMIACDNDNCELEWFHYQCVGLKDPPKGAWYCKECQVKMKKQRR